MRSPTTAVPAQDQYVDTHQCGAVETEPAGTKQLSAFQFDIKDLLSTLGQIHIDTLQAVNASAGAGEADID